MQIKVNKTGKVSGIPPARVAVSSGRTDMGAGQIMVVISVEDVWQCSFVCSSLRMSPQEARDVAARLIAAAGEVS